MVFGTSMMYQTMYKYPVFQSLLYSQNNKIIFILESKLAEHMIMIRLLLLLTSLHQLRAVISTSCPNTSTTGDTKPLYLVTLVPYNRFVSIVSGALVAQDEINNRTNLLPGYHIELIIKRRESCSSDHLVVGLSNLLKYTIDPPCRPVVAVSGLGCSSHTIVMSPIASNLDLIQLAAVNSPILQTQNYRFPHLWTFIGSATVYADIVIALLDEFNWKRVGLVYDSGSAFTRETAVDFEKKIKSSRSKNVVFSKEIRGTTKIYFDSVISGIKSQGVTILVVMLRKEQDSILVTRAVEEGLLYPQYTWIHVEIKPELLANKELHDPATIFTGIQGHIFLVPLTAAHNPSARLVSGEPYSAFEQKFENKRPQLKNLYNGSDIISGVAFGSYYYDQVWALALALNKSLPVLRNKNLSIDHYTIGQPEITNVIEEQMANLSFKGAGGLVEFNQYRSVSTPVQIIWFIGETEHNVGIYNPLNVTNFHTSMNASDLPKDRLDDVYVLIPLPVAIVLYVAAAAVVIFTTIQLVLFMYLHYNNSKVVRATSPYLSLVMFVGCYLFCLAAIFSITEGSFFLSPSMFSATTCLTLLSTMNAFSLTLTTLFLKRLRVYHIFKSSNHLKSNLSKKYKNYSLFFFILLLALTPNIIFLLSLIFEIPARSITRDPNFINVVHIHLTGTGPYVAVACMFAYHALFLLLILFLAIRTRKIEYHNFKDTKKINLFIAFVFIIATLGSASVTVLILREKDSDGYVVLTVCLLILPTACQLVLFLPKILPTILSGIRNIKKT